jgi:hypothetical protein
VIDGEVTSFFEWLGAGVWKADPRSEAMHGQRRLIRQVHYGADGENFYLRVDFQALPPGAGNMEVRLRLQAGHPPVSSWIRARLEEHQAVIAEAHLAQGGSFECAWLRVLELRLPLAALGAGGSESVQMQISLWQDSLPIEALPAQGWLDCGTTVPPEWPL